MLVALALGGCTQLDRLMGARGGTGVAEPESTPTPTWSGEEAETEATVLEPCAFPWNRDLPPVTREDLRIGPVVFRGLASPEAPWWYATGSVVAEQLRRGAYDKWSREDALEIAGEIVDNGPNEFVAQDVLVDLPAGVVAEIAVPEDDPNVSLLPRGVSGFGGHVPADGVKRVVCDADDATTFHVGFVVAGPRCVPVIVVVDGKVETRRVRFGVRKC